jgi:hypothetical protein
VGLTGKYDFKGIKEKGAAGLRLALLSSPYTAWLARFPALSNLLLEGLCNWMANKGLIVMNLGAYYVEGKLDQKAFDSAMEQGLKHVESGEKLTPEQIKDIDDAVIAAADKFLPYGKTPKPKRDH